MFQLWPKNLMKRIKLNLWHRLFLLTLELIFVKKKIAHGKEPEKLSQIPGKKPVFTGTLGPIS